MNQLLSGLRFRLLLLVALACAPLVGLALHTAWQDRRRQVADWRQRSREMMQLAAREDEKAIGQTRQLLLAVAESSQVRSGNQRDCKKLLDELFASYPRYANLGVIKTNGDVLASALAPIDPVKPAEMARGAELLVTKIPPASVGPVNQADREFFRRVLKTRAFALGDFPVEPVEGKPTVNIGYPVFNQSGQVQAVVFAVLELGWLDRFESQFLAQLPKGATWTEIDRKGRILVHYPEPEQWIGQPFPQRSLLKTVFSEDQGVVEALDPEGIPEFYAFASRPSQFVPGNVIAILSIPKHILFAEVDRRLTRNLAGLALAVSLVLALGWISSRYLILRPVQVLVNSSARLAAGDLTARTGLRLRGGELGQLTRTFDQMAQALEQRETDHQRTEQALKTSEIRYRRLFESAQDGILILNADTGQIEDVNPCLTELLGYSRELLLGKEIWQVAPFKDIQQSRAEFRKLQCETCVRYEDLPLATSDGRRISVEFVSNAYQANGHRVVQCNIRNITERKLSEEGRAEYSHKLQVLSQRLVEAQETERRHIARELHDEIGQALTVAQLNLQAMLQLPGTNALAPRLTESLEVVERVLEQVHDISLNLRPSMLDDLGLEPALRWYTNRQAALAGMQSLIRADSLEQRLDPVIETTCFRVAQEALTNVVRHARAQTVTVELRIVDGQLHLRVRDDGRGFDVAAVREQAVRGVSLGLLGMEERAALADGGLEYISHPGHGTEIHAWFPLNGEATHILI